MSRILYLCHPEHGCHSAAIQTNYHMGDTYYMLIRCECPEMRKLLLKSPTKHRQTTRVKPLKQAFRDLFKAGWRAHPDYPSGWKPSVPR
jgi:hypothetical protein